MMNEPSSCSKANGGRWTLQRKLAHSFPAKHDRHNQPGKAMQYICSNTRLFPQTAQFQDL